MIIEKKFKVKSHYDRDRNFFFFYKIAQIKQAYNKITSLKVENNFIADQKKDK